jgi:hypothetical protein
MPRPSHPSRHDHSNYTWRRVQVMKPCTTYMFIKTRTDFHNYCKRIVREEFNSKVTHKFRLPGIREIAPTHAVVNEFLSNPPSVSWSFLIRVVGGGVHTVSTRHVGHFWPIVPAPCDCEDGEVGGLKIGRGNRNTRRKPAPAPICPPQIPLDQTRARMRATTVRSQRLTASTMVRPFFLLF